MSSLLNIDQLRAYCVDHFNKSKKLGQIHGVAHWDRVAENGKRLFVPGADADVIAAFAYLHDVERQSDGRDVEHGDRAANVVRIIRNDLLKEFDDTQIEKLQRACSLHTTTTKTGDITIDICFDADRLDLTRVGIIPDSVRMATLKGRQLAIMNVEETKGKKFIFALFNAAQKYYNPVISNLDLAIGAVYKYGLYDDNRYTMIEAAQKYTFSDEVFGKLLRTMIIYGRAPITKLNEEEILFDRADKRYLMNKSEYSYYNRLPDRITIYRGTSQRELQRGVFSPSWTDDLSTAINFAKGSYDSNDLSPRIVIKAEIEKKYIKAVFIQGFMIFSLVELIYYHHADYCEVEIERYIDPLPLSLRDLGYQHQILDYVWKYNRVLRNTEFIAKVSGLWPKV